MKPAEALRRAAAAFAARDLAAAKALCGEILGSAPADADALHLLGLITKASGDIAGAERLLRASIDIAPRRAEFRVNLGNLLRASGRLSDAEAEYRRAVSIDPEFRNGVLALARLLTSRGAAAEAEQLARTLVRRNPRDAEAWAALGAAARERGQLASAEEHYRRALSLRPDYAVARHNLGALLGRMQRAEESLRELEHAAALGVAGPALEVNRAQALLELGRFDDAERALETAIGHAPEHVEAHVLLAKLRYMRGDDDYTRSIHRAATSGRNIALGLALGDLLRRGDRLEEARTVLETLASRHPRLPELESSLAVVLQEQGRLHEALVAARRAHAAKPDDAAITENLIALLLQLGDAAAAWEPIRRERRRSPLDQRWLAYEATAARLIGSAEYESLYDYERFVRTFEIEPPEGYETVDDFNRALAAQLSLRHTLRAAPLDQSLRHGTQSRRDLLHDPDPVIKRFVDAMRKPLEAYRAQIGADPRHPFLARNEAAGRLAGCWSVQLGHGGYHVNHIHPQGWISSAYYVSVPHEVRDEAARSGWLKFGEPRMPTPGAAAACFVQPRSGTLVLFPSYMWHGTTPLHGDEARLTLAFDAVPG